MKVLKGGKVKKGDKVTTVFGEELEVLDVKTVPLKKQGVLTGKAEVKFLAESGGHKCWFNTWKYLPTNKQEK